MSMLTWREMVKIEPQLEQLLAATRRLDTGLESFCGVTAWCGFGGRPGLKMRMYHMVGFGSSKPELRTREAYELATKKLYAAIPPCRGCACVEEEELRCA
jgi:hypothetical protein